MPFFKDLSTAIFGTEDLSYRQKYPVGSKLFFLGKEVTVVGYDKDMWDYTERGIRVNWFNNVNELQSCFITEKKIALLQ
jgi:hypothetical protein